MTQLLALSSLHLVYNLPIQCSLSSSPNSLSEPSICFIHQTSKMPRQQRRAAPTPARSAPTRPTAAPSRPAAAPQQQAPHSTAAHPQQPQQAPPMQAAPQQSAGPGLFGQMASTAAYVILSV